MEQNKELLISLNDLTIKFYLTTSLQLNKLKKRKTFQLSKKQLEGKNGRYYLQLKISHEKIKQLIQNTNKGKGCRFHPDEIEWVELWNRNDWEWQRITPICKTKKQCLQSVECPVCMEEMNNKNYTYLNCNHELCMICITTMLNMAEHKKLLCPLCREITTKIYSII